MMVECAEASHHRHLKLALEQLAMEERPFKYFVLEFKKGKRRNRVYTLAEPRHGCF